MQDQRRDAAAKEAATGRATDAQVLADAERLIAAWNDRQAERMPMLFSPTIGAAIAARLLTRTSTYGVEIKPLLVATTNRLPQRTIESTRPTPGTVCPGVTFQTPFGPSITAVPLTTSRSVQPSMVVGLVSGLGVSFVGLRTSFTLTPANVVCRGATVESLLASRDSGAVPAGVRDPEERFGLCGASAAVSRPIL